MTSDAPQAAAFELAIIIPAWKPTYLQAALASVAAQSDQRFVCHIFDDAAVPEVARICREFPQFAYTRFEDNLGGRSLVAQWNRCLQSVNAHWVWLFSDDDVMSPDCVAGFYAARQRAPRCLALQFDVDMVDDDLATVLWAGRPPPWESAADFVAARLRQQRLSCMPDHVFHLQTLRALAGGVVEMPLGWNADDATWALLGLEHGLAGVPTGRVSWRQSSENLSNGKQGRNDKLGADLQFLAWLASQPQLQKVADQHAARWLGTRLIRVYGFTAAELPMLLRLLHFARLHALLWAAVVLARDALTGWRRGLLPAKRRLSQDRR